MDVRLPNLGEGADSGTVAAVFIKQGDTVDEGQALLELESEKAVASVPSPAAGRVTGVHVSEGDEVRTGSLLVTLDTGGEGAQSSGEPPGRAPEAARDRAAAPAQPAEVERESGPFPPAAARLGPTSTKPPSPRPPEGPPELPEGVAPAASPSIRKIARDLGIELGQVRGTARGGRIVLGDLRDYIARLQSHAPAPAAPAPVIDFSRWGPVETVRLSAIRKTIATRMVESWRRVPHVTQFADADITHLMELRKAWVGPYKEKGARLTLTPILLRTLARVLGKHPLLNSSLDEESASVVLKKYCHLGIAVDTEAGLIVPVIRNADQKTVFELALEVEELGERARQRKVTREDLQGGSFTVSNQGGIGGVHFTPIINYPEVAILGVGRGREVVGLSGGELRSRLMLPLTVSHDHRVVDGADGVRFLTELVNELENISESEFALS